MNRILLDANLSPKIGRSLERQFGFDVFSLIREDLGDQPDHEIVHLAHRSQRVVITQDRDFAEYFFRTRRQPIGIIYLNLPNHLRTVPTITDVLSRFFDAHAAQVVFADVLVVLSESEVRIVQGPRRIS